MAEAKDLASWPTMPPTARYEKGEMLHYPAIAMSGHFEGSPTPWLSMTTVNKEQLSAFLPTVSFIRSR